MSVPAYATYPSGRTRYNAPRSNPAASTASDHGNPHNGNPAAGASPPYTCTCQSSDASGAKLSTPSPPAHGSRSPPSTEPASRELGDQRVALDYNLPIAATRRFDDVGFFSAIQLAGSYRALAALSRAPERANFQYLSGARELPAAALANAGVRFDGSLSTRRALPLRLVEGGVNLYEVPSPVPRALFFPAGAVRYWNEPEMAERLRDARFRLDQQMLLPLGRIGPEPAASEAVSPTPLVWRRDSRGDIEIDVVAATQGYVRLLESYDGGWTVSLDGEPVEVQRADGFLLAAPVPAGAHRLRFAYRTPGATAGALMSLAVLVIALALARRYPPPLA